VVARAARVAQGHLDRLNRAGHQLRRGVDVGGTHRPAQRAATLVDDEGGGLRAADV